MRLEKILLGIAALAFGTVAMDEFSQGRAMAGQSNYYCDGGSPPYPYCPNSADCWNLASGLYCGPGGPPAFVGCYPMAGRTCSPQTVQNCGIKYLCTTFSPKYPTEECTVQYQACVTQ